MTKTGMPESNALSGVRVIVTRAKEQSAELIDMLEAAGAEVVAVPVIQTVPPEDKSGIDRAVASLSSYDYAVFTSVNSIKFLLLRMDEMGKGPEDLKGLRIVAVGPKTAAALGKNGLKADIIADESRAEGIVLALSGEDIRGKKFLYPRAEVAREVLPEALRAAGADRGRGDRIQDNRAGRVVRRNRRRALGRRPHGLDLYQFVHRYKFSECGRAESGGDALQDGDSMYRAGNGKDVRGGGAQCQCHPAGVYRGVALPRYSGPFQQGEK